MNDYKVRKIDAHTWQLEDPFRTYLYLLEGTERAALIDAGNGFEGLKETVASLTDKPVSVFLTHGHFDHTGAAAEFERCYLHKDDLSVLREGFDKEMRRYQVQRFDELFQTELTEQEKAYLINASEPWNFTFYKEGDVLELGGRELEVIGTPGHTKGSVVFLDRQNRQLFSGDTVCNREILVYFDHSATVEDVRMLDEKLLARHELYRDIWPGHHECPLDASCIEDYRNAACTILENPAVGDKIRMGKNYKLLYKYKSIGISYTESHIYRSVI